ncbi:MAG: hypothetical protein QM652_08310 [Legionella sp.]|uniref:hypothetical protein n=1 Tax=Legionella sp. TaxID=459 RepID=UPI0039E5054E
MNESALHQLMNNSAVSAPKIERFWVREHSRFIHQDLLFLAPLNRAKTPYAGRKSSLVLPKHLSMQLQQYSSITNLSPHHLLCTIVLIYLYRLNNYKNYSVHITDASFKTQLSEFSCFLSDTLPLTTNLTHDTSFEKAAHQIDNELVRLKHHETFCSDLFVRYPELQVPKKEVLIHFIEQQESTMLKKEDYKLILSISKDDGTSLHIHNNTNYQAHEASYPFFNRIEEHLAILLEDALTHPNTTLHELLLVSEKERCLMSAWNKTAYDYDITQLLHQYIEQKASSTSCTL